MSLIWGIDTLFKMGAGLDIQQVLLTNAAFTLGSMVFEVPTGVVADTVGRRVSLLLDRKSTRLNSSHGYISYAVFCLKKKETVTTACREYDNIRRGGFDEIDHCGLADNIPTHVVHRGSGCIRLDQKYPHPRRPSMSPH